MFDPFLAPKLSPAEALQLLLSVCNMYKTLISNWVEHQLQSLKEATRVATCQPVFEIKSDVRPPLSLAYAPELTPSEALRLMLCNMYTAPSSNFTCM